MSTSTTHTQRMAFAHWAPKGLLHEDRCGSATELLGAVVDVRGHHHVSTAATRSACSPRCAGNPTSFDPSPDKPFGLAKLRSSRHLVAKAEAPTEPALHKSQTGQPFAHRAPGLTTRMPPPDLLTTRRHTQNLPCTCSAEDLRVSPKTRLGPLPVAVHPANRMVDPESALSGNLISSGNGKALTVRMAACYGARRCCHRHVVPAGQPASRRSNLDPHTLRLGADAPRFHVWAQDRNRQRRDAADPSLPRPSVATTRTRANSETSPPPRAVRGSRPLARPVRVGAFGPSPARLRQWTNRSGPQEDPPQAVSNPKRASRRRRLPWHPPLGGHPAPAPKRRGG